MVAVNPVPTKRIFEAVLSHAVETELPSSLYTLPEIVISSAESSHVIYPGLPPSLSKSSPAMSPLCPVNLQELTEIPDVVTFTAEVTPDDVAKTFPLNIRTGFTSIAVPSTVIAESELFPTRNDPWERSTILGEPVKVRPSLSTFSNA